MNTELVIVMRDFCEHALISLSKDYRNYFVYTKGSKSKILKYFNFYDLDGIIEELIYKLFLNGNIKLYFYLEKNKLYLSEKKNDTGNIILVKNFKWNLSFLSEHKRKKIVKRLKKLEKGAHFELPDYSSSGMITAATKYPMSAAPQLTQATSTTPRRINVSSTLK